jgi:hypothetical protein
MALNDYLEDKVEVNEEFKGVPFRMPKRAETALATVDSYPLAGGNYSKRLNGTIPTPSICC